MICDLFPYDTASTVFDIDYEGLYELGYRGLLFDIDNTLVHHGEDSTPEVDALIRGLTERGFSVLLLSDNDEARVRRFVKNMDVAFLSDAGKPDPAAYRRACEMLGLRVEQAVMIGDQLFTDIRGANRCGMASILVDFIRQPQERWLGWRRYAQFVLMAVYRVVRPALPSFERRRGEATDQTADRSSVSGGNGTSTREEGAKTELKDLTGEQKGLASRVKRFLKREILFCEISPLTYKLSEQKGVLTRFVKDLFSKERFSREKKAELLPYVAAEKESDLIKRGPGIDPELQQNKVVNINIASRTFDHLVIHPGETFSFWQHVGQTTAEKGYRAGRIIKDGKLIPGLGGGLCNLANTLHVLVRETPLTVTELHTHSDALAPDHGPRRPFANGTSVSYNNVDFRFRNDTDQDFQLVMRCEGDRLDAQIRCEHEFPYFYRLTEEGHHFQKEGDKYYRVSKIYHETYDKKTGELVKRELILDNHSEVMYDMEEQG